MVSLNIVIVIYREATRTILNLYHGGVRKNRNKMRGDPSSNQNTFRYVFRHILVLSISN